ncbi:MAG: bifunctional UDP-N-acetylmuramoyl-tripeptide:D-alanyl-D-alanine ligase/alanine racemase [Candidatus Cardinium sp.]|nr:bifunctional UDP-N-acetylmuramoyl-tripeptide:D-alanyl-D-alanine ligase/alanine racemase [Candidatus Cardinium sp.]
MPIAYFNELVSLTKGEIIAQVDNFPITELTVDSRHKTITDFPLFFALVGTNHDGHAYIQEAYQKGIRQFIVNRNHAFSLPAKDVNILQVPHTLTALQQLAAFHRTKFPIAVLAITGSNGKTIVKEWMHLLLSSQYKTISSPHSYNSQVGVPLSVVLLEPYHAYAIFEAGISTKGEMTKLAQIIQPTHGLFTNIGAAHSQGFQDEQDKLTEKANLFTACSKIYYCKEHASIHTLLQQRYANNQTLVSWSLKQTEATYSVTLKQASQQTTVTIQAAHGAYDFTVSFQDYASLENLIHCLVYALDNGYNPAQLQSLLPQLKPLPMRLTLKSGIHRCQLIDDSYSNDLTSLKLALDFMQSYHKEAKQTIILSDMLQSSLSGHALYASIAHVIQSYPIYRLIGIGTAISAYSTLFTLPEKCFFNTVETFMAHQPSFTEEVILIKGARPFQLERIVKRLENNKHGTILEIDIQAIRHNLCYFRSKLNASTKIMAMVKAANYGSSSNQELALLLQRYGLDYLGVAYVEEAIHAREQGITLPIMVMHPTDDQFEAMFYYQLEPAIYSVDLLAALIRFLKAKITHHVVPIHLKLETGLYRLGISANELNTLLKQLKQCPPLQVISLFSHLAASGTAEQDAYTLLQAERFRQMTQYIETKLGIQPLKHLLNSNGVLRFPQFQFDMVRLGIGLHGVGVSKTIQPHLIPSSTLKTTVSQVKEVPKGATIGYNRKALAKQETTIAIIPIGYADGLSRTFGNGKGHVVIQNRHCPIIGNICMDMAMVDITGMQVKRGEEVILFNAQHSVEELAQQIGTISYEILTQISQRVKRIYYI